MKFVLAPDSFKGSLSSIDVATAMESGIRRVCPDAEIIKLPIADGGEGTLHAIMTATGGRTLRADVSGPLGGPMTASFGMLPDSRTAVIEMAEAAGLTLIEPSKRDPRRTTTYGVGQLIQQAVNAGAEAIVIGIGGSCTNDGGAGMMQALGAKFIDGEGREIDRPIAGADLIRLAHIDLSGFTYRTHGLKITVASDVTNPLTGPNGATVVYGPQKGATADIVAELEAAMTNYAKVIQRDLNIDTAGLPGAGAAGGLGAGLLAFMRAEIRSGIDLILDLIGFEEKAEGADFVFTGEGRIDSQTVQGKLISGLLERCNRLKVPLIAFGGAVDADAEEGLAQLGIAGIVPITNRCMTLDEAIEQAAPLIESASARTIRLIQNSRVRLNNG